MASTPVPFMTTRVSVITVGYKIEEGSELCGSDPCMGVRLVVNPTSSVDVSLAG